MNRQLVQRNRVRPGAYVAAALTALAILMGIGTLLTYRVANTTGIVVAQFLQPGPDSTSAQ